MIPLILCFDPLHISASGHSQGIDYAYDSVGNFLKKTDYSQNSTSAYQYQSGSHRLTSVRLKSGTLKLFTYDNKGNQTGSSAGTASSSISYNVFNKPTNINQHGSQVNLFYDANWARYKQTSTTANVTTTTYYVGNYEIIKKGSTTTTLSYLGDTAIYKEVNGAASIRFTHKDRLGSTATFSDHNGNAKGYRSYDPFGKPKMGNGRTMDSYGLSARLASNINDTENTTKRGFTGHEHLDEVELIHMNGRIYDYNVGRFLSVDPFIQGVGNSQGINPYSYVMNNPLGYTDPSGYTANSTEGRDRRSACPNSTYGCEASGWQRKQKTADNGVIKSQQTGTASEIADIHSKVEAKGGALTLGRTNADGTVTAHFEVPIPTNVFILAKISTNQSQNASATTVALPMSAAAATAEGAATRTSLGAMVGRALGLGLGLLTYSPELADGTLPPSMLAEQEAHSKEMGRQLGVAISEAHARNEDFITIFRSASPTESADIRSSTVFRYGPSGFPKQFTLNYTDAAAFQKVLPVLEGSNSKYSIFSARISTRVAARLYPNTDAINGRSFLYLTASSPSQLNQVNTSAKRYGGIQELR